MDKIITDLYKYFDNDLSNIEDRLVQLIKNGYTLMCVWLCDKSYVLPLPTEKDSQNLYYAGYFKYIYEESDNRFLQIRDSIERDINGDVVFADNATLVSEVSEKTLKNMIYNAYTTKPPFKSTYNSLIDETWSEDFFSQWNFNPFEPDRIYLLEPCDTYRNPEYDSVKAKEVPKFILHWADKYPHYLIPPSQEYYEKVNG